MRGSQGDQLGEAGFKPSPGVIAKPGQLQVPVPQTHARTRGGSKQRNLKMCPPARIQSSEFKEQKKTLAARLVRAMANHPVTGSLASPPPRTFMPLRVVWVSLRGWAGPPGCQSGGRGPVR